MQVSVRERVRATTRQSSGFLPRPLRTAWAPFIPPEELAGLSAPQRWRTETVIVSEGDGDGVVGFAVLRRSEDDGADATTGELDLIYTSPSVRTRRWTGLDDVGARPARSDGYREATLWTDEPNARPRRFYEMVGWRLDGARRTKTALGTTVTEARYRITL